MRVGTGVDFWHCMFSMAYRQPKENLFRMVTGVDEPRGQCFQWLTDNRVETAEPRGRLKCFCHL